MSHDPTSTVHTIIYSNEEAEVFRVFTGFPSEEEALDWAVTRLPAETWIYEVAEDFRGKMHLFEAGGEHPDFCTCGEHISLHEDKLDALAKRTMERIVEHGHEVRFVFPTDEDPDGHLFWYSIGRTVKDRPELLITGPLSPQVGMWMINQAAKMDDESPLQPGQELPAGTLLEGFPVRIVEADPLAAEMFGATSNFGEDDVTALQIVWPDQAGNWPGDDAWDERFVQPIFAKEA